MAEQEYPFGYPPYSVTVAPMNETIESDAMTTTPSVTKKPSTIWTGAFWKGAGERAIKTAAQTFVAVVGVTGVGTTLGLGQIHWTTDLSVVAVTTILSVVTSVVNSDFTAGVS